MRKFRSVYIHEAGANWILKILGDDIYNGLSRLGYNCRKGPFDDYEGEDISLHMWWRFAQPYPEAKVNAVFVTHTDDSTKEADLIKMKDQFDIFITMSPEDAQFLIELGFEKGKVFGLNLPVRNAFVRPMSIGIFSACYPDHRKNDHWLQEYCSTHELAKLANFVFIGSGWGDFVSCLEKDKCSFQWINISRELPFEYFYQQLLLSNVDYYVYMGMDGGAMGTYDAYAMGVRLCVADDGYHKSIPDIDNKFSTKEGFFDQMDAILSRQARRLEFFEDNSIDKYVYKLAYIFENAEYPNIPEKSVEYQYSVKDKRRSNYFKLTLNRFRQPFVSAAVKWQDRRKRAKKEK